MLFNSKPIPEHKEVPLADDGRWEAVIAHWQRKNKPADAANLNEKKACYLLSVSTNPDPNIQKAQLNEIANLVEAAGDYVVGSEIYNLKKPNPKTLIGSGVSEDVAARAFNVNADILVLDAQLSPSQMRNLEDVAGITIMDREAVILNVFLRQAQTRRSRIQVEIAQLEYLRPRIRGIGLNMDQQVGGITGSRGAGETASELLARKLDGRLASLHKVQKKLAGEGKVQKQHRSACKKVVLVGYTNAGKTSLMNGLSSENLSSKNRPFETLDTTTRHLSRHGGDVIISDTVGFIRNLPKSLLASFESTLMEIQDANLILIVIDASDYEWKQHIQTTLDMLHRLGAADIPRYFLFNKMDVIKDESSRDYSEASGDCPYFCLSSLDRRAVRQVKDLILDKLRARQKILNVFIPYSAGTVLSDVYSRCRVLESNPNATGLRVTIQAEAPVLAKIETKLRKLKK